ncbi:MAG: ATP-grasp domain-containing protein [Clostridium sp.]|nr:ATP-grasp domain-containing protein [Clostridium sp.]
MRVLILSVGTRCQLVKFFMERKNGFDKIVTTDCSNYAPAIYLSDKNYIVPKMTKKEYLPTIKKICITEQIDVIIPLQENELEIISYNRKMFEKIGCLVPISDYEIISMCKDKYKLYQYLSDRKIPCVTTHVYEQDNVREKFPVIVKERYGAGSIGLLKVNSDALLKEYIHDSEKQLIIQPYIRGKEYGVDAYIDCVNGEVVSIFVKEKLRMRAGETEKSISVKNEMIFSLIKNLLQVIKFKGAIDIDVLEDEGNYYILEINPRFGGGYPHAYESGVNFVKYLSKNANKLSNIPEIQNYKEGTILLKYTEALLFNNEEDMF